MLFRKMLPINCSRLPLRLSKRTGGMQFSTENDSFTLDKVLVLNKVSRLEAEKISNPHLNDEELKKSIKARGIDYTCLLKHHELNKNFQNKVVTCIKSFGINVREVNRFSCTNKDVEWCDAVVPVGGDGTFLNAARRIYNKAKPVIGFNSDPSRSEGFLCLPKKYSFDIGSALKKLTEGNFKWMFRSRIRVSISGNMGTYTPVEIHDLKPRKLERSSIKADKSHHKLPILALNEVFMSEIFAAKVSYFEMRLNDCQKSAKIKSSGLCVCTGTGSTSWNLSINRLSKQDIHDILMLYISETNGKLYGDFERIVKNVSDNYNQKFKFDAEEQYLGYTIRDLISLGVWPQPKGLIEPKGYAKTIELKSKCVDAAIIIDGGVSFPFNEGSVSRLEMRPEDALRTVVLNE